MNCTNKNLHRQYAKLFYMTAVTVFSWAVFTHSSVSGDLTYAQRFIVVRRSVFSQTNSSGLNADVQRRTFSSEVRVGNGMFSC